MTVTFACGDDVRLASTDPYQPYSDNATTVIGGDDSAPIASGAVGEDGCLQITADSCFVVEPEGRYCRSTEGPIDAVAIDGRVVDVVCYSDSDAGDGPSVIVDSNQDGNIDIPQQQNGGVIVFDPSSDGRPITGDVTLDANDVTLYGNGPDKSIIQGDLVISGNNARIRGVRVMGNVKIALNTAAIVFVIIDGNLEILTNNNLVAETSVFGQVVVTGNNTKLVSVGVAGNWEISGSNSTCNNNRKFADASGDHLVQKEEYGTALTCP